MAGGDAMRGGVQFLPRDFACSHEWGSVPSPAAVCSALLCTRSPDMAAFV